MRKLAPARVSYQDAFWISYRVCMMTGPFPISLFEGTLHLDKNDFTPKRVVVSRLHDTVARFRTGVKFSGRKSPRCHVNTPLD